MDAKRTLYVEGISQIPDAQLAKVLAPIGIEKPYRLKGPTLRIPDSVFLQFKSAAHIKAALAVLPQLKADGNLLEAIASQETADWVASSAVNATVESVTRMAPAALVTRLQTALNQASREPRKEETQTEEIKEDGTLTSEDFPENIQELRREVKEFRRETVENTKRRDKKNREIIEQAKEARPHSIDRNDQDPLETDEEKGRMLNEEFEAIDEKEAMTARPTEPSQDAELAWAKFLAKNEARQAIYDAKKADLDANKGGRTLEYYLNYTDKGFRGDPKQRQLQRSEELELDAAVGTEESSSEREEDAAVPEKISLAIKKGPAWPQVTDEYISEHIRPVLTAKIEELFGELDESLLEFMENLIRDQKTLEEMAQELEGPLDDEAQAVAEDIYALLPR